MYTQDYLNLLSNSEKELAEAFSKVSEHHQDEPDIYYTCRMMSEWSDGHAKRLEPFLQKYAQERKKSQEPERLTQVLFKEPRKGNLALLRDLHDLWLLTKEIEISDSVLLQAARALRDRDLESLLMELSFETGRQTNWLLTRIKQAAPQILTVPV